MRAHRDRDEPLEETAMAVEEEAAAEWVERVDLLPKWLKKTDLHDWVLITAPDAQDAQGERIAALEKDLRVAMDCFERPARQG
jgi:hypothetical protein